jgi:hypothetical protein
VSPGKLGMTGGGPWTWAGWFKAPQGDVSHLGYNDSIVLRYAMEQFAMPLDPTKPLHPAGSVSAMGVADPYAPLGQRRSDEGADLLAWAIDEHAAHQNMNYEEAFDNVFRQRIGRGLEPLSLDMHTAAVLKDYRGDDLRFRFQWVGDYNAGVAVPPVPGAPPPAPSLDTMRTFQPTTLTGLQVGFDNLWRVARWLDTWEEAPALQKKFLPKGASVSGADVLLQPYGAAYLSVRPEKGYGLAGVTLRATKGTHPRFRVFQVLGDDKDAKPFFQADCNQGQVLTDPNTTGMCKPDSKGFVSLSVPTTVWGKDVSEIIVVASAGKKAASLSWRFGPSAPTVSIVDPTTSRPVPVGHKGDRRRFLVKLDVREKDLSPLGGLAPDKFRISVRDCEGVVGKECALQYGQDFKVAGLNPGVYWAKVTIPAANYPAADGLLGLRVEVDSGGTPVGPAIQDQSLIASVTPPKVASQIVIDRSGSMKDYDKMNAAKKAATLLVDGMPDADDVGVVVFNDNAVTLLATQANPSGLVTLTPLNRLGVLFAIDNITAESWTSLGDGVLEAQSNFVRAYGDKPATPMIQNMIALSDGMTNADWHPVAYYYYMDPNAPHTDGDNTAPSDPWVGSPLCILDRKANGYIVPTVSTIAIGQDADQTELVALQMAGGGSFTYIEQPVNDMQFMSAVIEMSDAFRQAANTGTGTQRVVAARSYSLAPGDLPSLSVERDADELLVSVAARDVPALQYLRLVSPGGAELEPAQRHGLSAVFRVASPEPGSWSWNLGGGAPEPRGPEPTVFVEQAVRSPIVLYGDVDVERPAPMTPNTSPVYESERWVGKDVVVHAMPTDGGDILGAAVTAEIRAPGPSYLNNTTLLTLYDDGKHRDGEQGDGIYGGVYRKTLWVGAYPVRIVATGTSPGFGVPFRRELNIAFAVHGALDSDEDRLPDWWEEENGTNPLVNDAAGDLDEDGLTNLEEFERHTFAQNADTDEGGESDGSEVAAGRDPHDRGDDMARVPPFAVFPGNQRVSVLVPVYRAGGPIREGQGDDVASTLFEVQGATAAEGPFETRFLGTAPPDGLLYLAAPNDQLACFRVRQAGGDLGQSGWSAVACATPRTDPFPPVARVENAAGSAWTRTRQLTLRIVASDDPAADPGVTRVVDPLTVASGVTHMMVSLRSDFVGASWVPLAAKATEWLPDADVAAVWVKVRDAAGNESVPASLVIRVAAVTPVDEALRLEERALDALHNHAWSAAREALQQSLPRIDASIRTVVERIAKCGQKPDKDDVELLVGLVRVRAAKTKSLALAKPMTAPLSEQALREALEREREIAERAAALQKPL